MQLKLNNKKEKKIIIVSQLHIILNCISIKEKEGQESDYEDMDEETKKELIKEKKRIKKMVNNDAKKMKEF